MIKVSSLLSSLARVLIAELEAFEDVGAPQYKDIYTTPEQLSDGLMTLSLLPRSRWQTLLNLETIKVNSMVQHRSTY